VNHRNRAIPVKTDPPLAPVRKRCFDPAGLQALVELVEQRLHSAREETAERSAAIDEQ